MKCDYCKKQLKESYIKLEGKLYHKECYESNVAPVCHQCGKIINGHYIIATDKKYHKSCYNRYIADSCDVCGQPIYGEYLLNYWGHKYHSQHKNEFPLCRYCGRLICDRLTQGGVKYSDGRSICSLCYTTSINDRNQINSALKEIIDELQTHRITIDYKNITTELVSVNELARIMGSSYNNYAQGTMRLTEQLENGVMKSRYINIYILFGMPRVRFLSVLAHELTHVWIKLNCDKLPLKVEEGTANLISYLILKRIGNSEAEYIIKSLMSDDDPVYGDGFRKAKERFDRMGLNNYLSYLEHKKPISKRIAGLVEGIFS